MKPAVFVLAAALLCGIMASDLAIAQSVRSGDKTAAGEAERARRQRESDKREADAKAKAAQAKAAQAKGGAKAPDPAVLKAEAVAAAPAMIKARGVYCTPTDANHMGAYPETVDGKKLTTTIIEVACQEGLGYIMSNREDGVGQANDCVAANAPVEGKPNPLACSLAANANPAAGLQPLLVKAGSICQVDKAAPIGSSATVMVYEVACKSGVGQVISVSLPRTADFKVTTTGCLAIVSAGVTCKLTTEEQNLSPVKALLAKSGKPCDVTKQRFVMAGQAGDYYEVACGDGTGMMLQADLKGDFSRAIGCGAAGGISGGCTLSDAKAASTADSALYTRLTKAAGFECDVNKYGIFPPRANVLEAVEVACNNRTDGGVLVTTKEASTVFNCGRSDVEGFKCSYSPADAAYKTMTDHLKSKNKPSCVVNGMRPIGVSVDSAYIEVTCADGDPGWVLRYPKGVNTPSEVLSCLQAQGVGGGCALPQNKRS